MRTKIIMGVLIAGLVMSVIGIGYKYTKDNKSKDDKVLSLMATVKNLDNETIKLEDEHSVTYTFDKWDDFTVEVGQNMLIEYIGTLDKNKNVQDVEVVNYEVYPVSNTKPEYTTSKGIFDTFYEMASRKLEELSLDEKIGQILLARVPETNQLQAITKYHLGGYVLFGRDFKDKSKEEVIDMINGYQKASTIPLLIATDEEGGTVVRVSSNSALAKNPFKSSRELYQEGGLELIAQDTKDKSTLLESLGINVNLAPVVDVSTSESDYMYNRSIGQNTDITSEFAKTVIKSSKDSKVSYVLKHFPGYGNNTDTHEGKSVDSRSRDDIMNNDIPPFKAGINQGAEAVLVSHNVVTSIDPDNPASLSKSIHELLRNDLNFTGVIITDDLAMGAIDDEDAVVKAIKAGNDLLIVTDYGTAISDIKEALNNKTITEEDIDKMAFKVLAWKYYKGLMMNVK